MKTTSTISMHSMPADLSAMESRLAVVWLTIREHLQRARPRPGRRYVMRHEALLNSPLGDEIRRAGWL